VFYFFGNISKCLSHLPDVDAASCNKLQTHKSQSLQVRPEVDSVAHNRDLYGQHPLPPLLACEQNEDSYGYRWRHSQLSEPWCFQPWKWGSAHNVPFLVNTVHVFVLIYILRMYGLVVRVLYYRSRGPGFDSRALQKKSSGSGTGSTQPREYNWGATWKKSSGFCLENREYGRRDPSRWPRGSLYRKSWQSLRRKAAVARSV
jgi:hypothetical protein